MERRTFLKLFGASGALIIPGVAPAFIRNAMPVRAIPLLAEPYVLVGEILVPAMRGVVACGWVNDFADVVGIDGSRKVVYGMTQFYQQFRDGRREPISYNQYVDALAHMAGGRAVERTNINSLTQS